jgi:RNA polymerase sigma-70 factor, ECF subfamily
LDRSLIERARDGDDDAFEEFVCDRMDAVYRLSFAIVGSEADARDSTQEAFVAAWKQLPRLRDLDRFDAWFGRICVNAARMTLRARGRRLVREISSDAVVARVGREDHAAPRPDDAARLGAALERLPVDQRAILALHHVDDRSVADLAAILGVPEGTVKSRLFTARRALQRALAERDGRVDLDR